MVAAALGFVTHFGSNVPWVDDWFQVDVLTGETPLTLEWLWIKWIDHRIPLTKLIFFTLFWLTGDLRTVFAFKVLALGALAAALIGTARRLPLGTLPGFALGH
jgi:hypothetical protein